MTVESIRQSFPSLQQSIHGHKPLVYLDNAATTQTPQPVLEALLGYYHHGAANVHRATHTLAANATHAVEKTRQAVQQFIHAKESAEIIFTSGTTASINLVASSFGEAFIQPGDEVVISEMEHHSNIVPWQRLCERKGAHLAVIPINDKGGLIMEEFEKRLTPRTKIVAITQVSNNLGTINPITEIVQKAHAVGAVVLVDAAQAVAHMPIDVQQLDCDFLVFSSHKMYGPTGVGVLYGKRAFLEKLPPYQVGGGMIDQVTFPQSTYSGLPYKFEAGTPNTANIVAFGAAIAWLQAIGWAYIMEHERRLSVYAKQLLQDVKGLRLISTVRDSVGILSFTVPAMHHLDVGLLLDAQGIAVRTGHGCAQPLMERLGVDGIVRASIGIYNTEAEMTYVVAQLARIIR